MFNGFTQETFEFFMAIRFNNNRTFFKANYEWYQDAVRTPCLELASSLCDTIEDIDPDLERRPYRALSHINRDIRFSNDKSPYRDYMWICFKHMDANKGKLPELYFDISDEGAGYGMGFYRSNATLMRRFRKRVDAQPDKFIQMYMPIAKDFMLSEFPDKKVIAPAEYPRDVQRIYAANRFYLSADIRDFDLIRSPLLAQYLINSFQQLKPLYKFICDPD